MADFVAVLKKTLDGMGETTPATRARVYEKARATIGAKLAAIDPPPPAAVADRQKRALEDAIAAVEKEYAAASDPLAELENVFASLKNPQPKVLAPASQPAPKAESWPRTTPAPGQPASTARAPIAPLPPAPPPTRIDTAAPRAAPPPDPSLEPTLDDDASEDFRHEANDDLPRRRGYGGLIAAGLVLAVIAGGAYGIWLNRDAFGGLFGGEETIAAAPPAETPPPAAEVPAEPPAAEAPAAAPATEGKFTQRLTPEGTETDPGPAGGDAGVGEGTSVAGLTQPPAAAETPAAQPPATPETPAADAAAPAGTSADPALPATPAETAQPPAATPAGTVAVAQKAIFYEERTSTAEGSAEPGSVVWSVVQESPGADLPPEPAIRAEATIPGKDVQLRMTVRRNADRTLPASHIIEMIFLTPDGFDGGGIDNILRIALKSSEQEAGSPLIGIPAKIADGFFLVALNDSQAEINSNLTLLRRQTWIDVPVVYKSGRRALFTMEKGIPGEKVFDDALKAWQTASASAG